MPSWTIHLSIISQVCQTIQMPNRNIFTFANIMPDIFEGHNTPNPSMIVKDYSTHYPFYTTIHGMEIELPDVQTFKKKYQTEFKNPVILGYYTHLLTDYYWNVQLYQNHYEMKDKQKGQLNIKLNDGTTKIYTFAEIQPIKHRELNMFSQYLNRETEIRFPSYDENILAYK